MDWQQVTSAQRLIYLEPDNIIRFAREARVTLEDALPPPIIDIIRKYLINHNELFDPTTFFYFNLFSVKKARIIFIVRPDFLPFSSRLRDLVPSLQSTELFLSGLPALNTALPLILSTAFTNLESIEIFDTAPGDDTAPGEINYNILEQVPQTIHLSIAHRKLNELAVNFFAFYVQRILYNPDKFSLSLDVHTDADLTLLSHLPPNLQAKRFAIYLEEKEDPRLSCRLNRYVPRFSHLDFFSTQILENSVQQLEIFNKIRKLYLAFLTPSAWLEVSSEQPNVITIISKKVNAHGFFCQGFGGLHLDQLRFFPNLEILSLPESEVQDAHLIHLKYCPKLTFVELPGNPLTSAAIQHLKQLPLLETLDVTETGISEAESDALLQSLREARGEIPESREEKED